MKIEIEIPDGYINGALESPHSRYWASEARWDPENGEGYVIERDGDVRHELDAVKLKAAIEFMAKRYPTPFSRLQSGNYDGPIGDLLMQLVAFGPAEAKYD